jgi:hypothetical protein
MRLPQGRGRLVDGICGCSQIYRGYMKISHLIVLRSMALTRAKVASVRPRVILLCFCYCRLATGEIAKIITIILRWHKAASRLMHLMITIVLSLLIYVIVGHSYHLLVKLCCDTALMTYSFYDWAPTSRGVRMVSRNFRYKHLDSRALTL